MTDTNSSIGVLYAGEMGAALMALARSHGLAVYTTAACRSNSTARRCEQAARDGVNVLSSTRDVVQQSDVVFSLVPPAAAQSVVEEYLTVADEAPPGALFVDANSIGPELSRALGARLRSAGREYVDAAINGLAGNLTTTATLFLSGPRAGEVEKLLGGAMRVRVLGDQIGQASAIKILLSAFAKGVCALFTETALVAQKLDMLETMCRTYADIYPGLMQIVQRMIPTYPQHAQRRADEMRELEQTVCAAGIEPLVTKSIRQLHELLASADFDDQANWTLQSVIQALATEDFLSANANADAKITATVAEKVGG